MHSIKYSAVDVPVNASNLKEGEFGLVADGREMKGCFVVMTYDRRLVCLNNPCDTWHEVSEYSPGFKVHVLKPGSQITITVGKVE